MSISKDPIFIVGAARSGTTMLQYMLRSHPELSLPTGESQFFIPFYQRRDEFGDLSNMSNLKALISQIYQHSSAFLDEELHGIRFNVETITRELHDRHAHTIPDVIAGIFELNAEAEGKTRWGDKTPYYVLNLETIIEMFPNAQIVHLIRDGRDCALSMLERKWDLQIFNTYHAAYIWNRSIRAGEEFGRQHPEIYYKIYYCDILNNPEKAISDLCRFLNIDFNSQIVEFKKSEGDGKTPLVSQPILTTNQCKWLQKMSASQIRIFEYIAGTTLSQCGYDTVYESPKISRLEWIFYELHIRLCHFYCKYFLKNK